VEIKIYGVEVFGCFGFVDGLIGGLIDMRGLFFT